MEDHHKIHSAMDEIEDDSGSDYEVEFHKSSSNTLQDDEDEPLLGKWFEDTLFPPEDAKQQKKATDDVDDKDANNDKDSDAGGQQSHVPDRGEPTGFISLASHIFIFMDKHLLMTQSGYVRRYVYTNLTEQQMTVLAAITRDLDLAAATMGITSSTSNKDDGKMEYNYLSSLFAEFSTSLANFTHNMLAFDLLTTKLTNSLLHQLGVYPFNSEEDWPLCVHPRTLAILTQVLAITFTFYLGL